MKKISMKEKGITLIALVITIIVLLILAGVTIATLTGDNGILTKATEAKDKTEEAGAREQVEIAVAGSMGANGELDNGDLKNNLNKIEGIEKITGEITDSDYPLAVTVDDEYSYLINKDGTIGEVVKREGIEVGDYVNYTPDENTTGYTTDKLSSSTGSSSNSTITQDTMKWRILAIHENGTVDLISEAPTSQYVYFQGVLGYNNGVLAINDICKELYSNSILGIEARSINLEDIEDQMNETGIVARDAYTGSGGIQYGNTKTYTGIYANYPNLYAQQNGSGIDTDTVKTNGIGESDEYYSSPTTETSSKASTQLTVTQTYYNMSSPSSYFDNSDVYNMIFGTGTYYWLASRYANCYSADARFGLRYVSSSSLNGDDMFNSYGGTYYIYYHLRPVVSLGSNIQITPVENPDGSSTENMHQISK